MLMAIFRLQASQSKDTPWSKSQWLYASDVIPGRYSAFHVYHCSWSPTVPSCASTGRSMPLEHQQGPSSQGTSPPQEVHVWRACIYCVCSEVHLEKSGLPGSRLSTLHAEHTIQCAITFIRASKLNSTFENFIQSSK